MISHYLKIPASKPRERSCSRVKAQRGIRERHDGLSCGRRELNSKAAVPCPGKQLKWKRWSNKVMMELLSWGWSYNPVFLAPQHSSALCREGVHQLQEWEPAGLSTGIWWELVSIKFDLLPPSSTTFPLSSSCRHFQQQADICYPNLLFCPALYARGIKEKIPPTSKTNHRWEAQALHQVLVWGLPPAPAEQSREGRLRQESPALGQQEDWESTEGLHRGWALHGQ